MEIKKTSSLSVGKFVGNTGLYLAHVIAFIISIPVLPIRAIFSQMLGPKLDVQMKGLGKLFSTFDIIGSFKNKDPEPNHAHGAGIGTFAYALLAVLIGYGERQQAMKGENNQPGFNARYQMMFLGQHHYRTPPEVLNNLPDAYNNLMTEVVNRLRETSQKLEAAGYKEVASGYQKDIQKIELWQADYHINQVYNRFSENVNVGAQIAKDSHGLNADVIAEKLAAKVNEAFPTVKIVSSVSITNSNGWDVYPGDSKLLKSRSEEVVNQMHAMFPKRITKEEALKMLMAPRQVEKPEAEKKTADQQTGRQWQEIASASRAAASSGWARGKGEEAA